MEPKLKLRSKEQTMGYGKNVNVLLQPFGLISNQ